MSSIDRALAILYRARDSQHELRNSLKGLTAEETIDLYRENLLMTNRHASYPRQLQLPLKDTVH